MDEKDYFLGAKRLSLDHDITDLEQLLPDAEQPASPVSMSPPSKLAMICEEDRHLYRRSRRLYLTALTAACSVVVLLLLNFIALAIPALHPARPLHSHDDHDHNDAAIGQSQTELHHPLTISCDWTDSHTTPLSSTGGPCLFDPIILAWLPPPCFNHALLNATQSPDAPLAQAPYEIAGPAALQIYADEGLQQPLTSAQVSELKQTRYWVSVNFHRAHCTYAGLHVGAAVARKAERGWRERMGEEEEDVGVEGENVYVWLWATRPTHMDHCAKVLNNGFGHAGQPEQVQAGLGICVKL